jgi:hypothetical protein
MIQTFYNTKNFIDNTQYNICIQATSNRIRHLPQNPHNQTLCALYFPRNIITDMKSRMTGNVASTRETTKWYNSPWKSLRRRGHFENKGLKERALLN